MSIMPYLFCPKSTVVTSSSFFFFNDTATTEIYTLSLHDALPISRHVRRLRGDRRVVAVTGPDDGDAGQREQPLADRPEDRRDRKSTRLNSSHANISYAVFCLKKTRTSPRSS